MRDGLFRATPLGEGCSGESAYRSPSGGESVTFSMPTPAGAEVGALVP